MRYFAGLQSFRDGLQADPEQRSRSIFRGVAANLLSTLDFRQVSITTINKVPSFLPAGRVHGDVDVHNVDVHDGDVGAHGDDIEVHDANITTKRKQNN